MASHNKEVLSTQNRIAVVRDYAALWQQFFSFFSDDLVDRSITEEEEQEFGNVVSLLSLNHFKFQELTRGYFGDAANVLGVIEQAVSLHYLQNMTDATFSKMQVEWHTLFIGMHKALGKLLSELSPKELAQLQGGVSTSPTDQ